MTRIDSTAVRLRIEVFGWQPFYRRPVRALLLAAFEALAPDHVGIGDAAPVPIERRRIDREPLGPGPVVMELLRAAAPSWHACMNLGDRAWMRVVVPAASLAEIGVAPWFELADRLADALEPDLAFVHLDLEPDRLAAEERERHGRMSAGVPSGEQYYDDGPGGLALRTFVGPRLLRRLGEQTVRELQPAAVRSISGGVVSVDLLEAPWAAETHDVLEAYESAMQQLQSANLFSKLRIVRGRSSWHRQPGVDLGGVARESPAGMRLDRQVRADGGDASSPEPDAAPLRDAVTAGREVVDMFLSWVDLRAANLTGLRADGLDLAWAQLEDAQFDDARIVGGAFDYSNLGKVSFRVARLNHCDFASSIAADSSWAGAAISGGGFVSAVLTSADFGSAHVDDTSFDDAMLIGARFDAAALTDCSFAQADCQNASFVDARLSRVAFSGANLRGANFRGATLDNVTFEGAVRG